MDERWIMDEPTLASPTYKRASFVFLLSMYTQYRQIPFKFTLLSIEHRYIYIYIYIYLPWIYGIAHPQNSEKYLWISSLWWILYVVELELRDKTITAIVIWSFITGKFHSTVLAVKQTFFQRSTQLVVQKLDESLNNTPDLALTVEDVERKSDIRGRIKCSMAVRCIAIKNGELSRIVTSVVTKPKLQIWAGLAVCKLRCDFCGSAAFYVYLRASWKWHAIRWKPVIHSEQLPRNYQFRLPSSVLPLKSYSLIEC